MRDRQSKPRDRSEGAMTGREHDEVARRLSGVGQRYTANRKIITEALFKAANPLTIPDILARHKTLAMSSVYRNLAVLEQAGVVHRVVTTGEFACYELAEDLTAHHHHLICTTCGKVEDFTASPNLEESATTALSRVASKAGFTVRSHRLDVLGICRGCA